MADSGSSSLSLKQEPQATSNLRATSGGHKQVTGTTRGLSLRALRPETPRGQGAQTLDKDLELRGGIQWKPLTEIEQDPQAMSNLGVTSGG